MSVPLTSCSIVLGSDDSERDMDMEPDGGADGSPADPVLRVFATSATFTGDLLLQTQSMGAVPPGDELCQEAADMAGLEGTYVAWLSDSFDNALDRITANGPWHLTDPAATEVLGARSDLLAAPAVPINFDESGLQVSATDVWTGTDATGSRTPVRCADWSQRTLVSGQPDSGTVGSLLPNESWTDERAAVCTGRARLYCFEN